MINHIHRPQIRHACIGRIYKLVLIFPQSYSLRFSFFPESQVFVDITIYCVVLP